MMKKKKELSDTNMVKIFLCILYILFSVSGLVLFKYAALNPGNGLLIPRLDIVISKNSIIGLICYGISFLLYISVISQFDLGYIFPIIGGINNILVIVASVFILKETITFNVIVGAVIVIAGIMIMNVKK